MFPLIKISDRIIGTVLEDTCSHSQGRAFQRVERHGVVRNAGFLQNLLRHDYMAKFDHVLKATDGLQTGSECLPPHASQAFKDFSSNKRTTRYKLYLVVLLDLSFKMEEFLFPISNTDDPFKNIIFPSSCMSPAVLKCALH